MKVGRGAARFFFYPLVRPMEAIRDASVKLKGDVDEVKRLRQAHRDDVVRRQAEYAAAGGELTEEQALNPKLIADPARRFEALVVLNQWTEEALDEQWIAARRGRRAAVISAILVVIGALLTMILAPVWLLVFLMPCLFIVSTYSFVSAFKYGVYQWQLEVRCLYGAKDFLSQPDFIRRIFA